MKAMQCELCGATNIVKDGDFFVCQSCGMKYTPESAKKMMVEGVVQVEGTVKVDNTQQIENFLSLARNAHDSDNEEEAEKYASKVLEMDPNNWNALYIKGIAAGWQTTGGNNRIPEAIDYFSQAIANCSDESNLEELKKKVAADISKLSLAMINLRCKNYIQLPSSESASSIVQEATNSIVLTMKLILSCGVAPEEFKAQAALTMNAAAVQAWKTIWSDYTDGKPLLPLSDGVVFHNYALVSLGDRDRYAIPSKYDWNRFTDRGDGCISVIKAAISIDDTDDEEDITRYENLIFIAEKVRDSCSIGYIPGSQYTNAKWSKEYSFTDSAVAARNAQIMEWKNAKEAAEKRARQKKTDAYWKDHSDEKEQLQEKLATLEQSKEKILLDDEYKGVVKETTRLNKEIEKLEAELAECGVFARKDKKRIRAQLDELEKEFAPIRDKKKSLDAEINKTELEIKKIQKKLDQPC